MLSPERNEYHVEVKETAINAVELLSQETGFSRQKIKQAMQKGAVWLTDNKGTQRLRRQSKKIPAGATLHFYFDPLVLDARIDNAVLVSDEIDYSVWYKPRGMLSQGSKWGDHVAINRWVEKHLEPQRPAFIVHRLDRFASGLIVIAHKKKVTALLTALFQKREIKKCYKVMVHGEFPNETITFNTPVDGKAATSHARLLEYDVKNDVSLLEINIETGRKHQIRIHLSEAGFPVVGDRLYGHREEEQDLQLTAVMLSFTSPVDGTEKKYILAEEYQPRIES